MVFQRGGLQNMDSRGEGGNRLKRGWGPHKIILPHGVGPKIFQKSTKINIYILMFLRGGPENLTQ